jgi:arginyl-tRNA synthetase
MIQDQVREIICNTLVHLCNSGVLPASVASPLPGFAIELPKNREHGDYATNVAMLLAKSAGKPPRVIADAIVANWQDPKGIIKSASVAGPGFINLNLADFALHQVVGEILQQGSRFGCHAPNGQKVLVEFVSPNATGPLHLGHARGAFMGDAVASLLSAAGYDVTRECYINDVGNQVKTLGKSVHARYRELFGESVVLDKDAYPGWVNPRANGWHVASKSARARAPETSSTLGPWPASNVITCSWSVHFISATWLPAC